MRRSNHHQFLLIIIKFSEVLIGANYPITRGVYTLFVAMVALLLDGYLFAGHVLVMQLVARSGLD